jgi:Fe-S-cluster containining protein
MDKYFACHQCGKCCIRPPTLMFDELFKFYRAFIVLLNFNPILTKNLMPNHLEHMKKFSVIIQSDQFQNYLVQTHLQAWNYPSLKRCDYLSDEGNCKIYQEAPLSCKMTPLKINLPENEQFIYEKVDAIYHQAGCLSSTPQKGLTELYKENKITNTNLGNPLNVIQSDLENYKHEVELLATVLNNFHGLLNQGQSHQNLFFWLVVLYVKQRIGRNQALTVFEEQAYLMEDAIQLALNRKNKEDKLWTDQLRNNIKVYHDAPNIFDKFADDICDIDMMIVASRKN